MRDSNFWHRHFLGMAAYVSQVSKDPSTKTGAIIVDSTRRVVSTGYNGFARGVEDHAERYADRSVKYQMVIHCETNAILFAHRPLTDCTLYTYPFMSCSRCATLVIQSGIKVCVTLPLTDDLRERWGVDCELSRQMFKEAGVTLIELPSDVTLD